MIRAGGQLLKMAASHFVDVSEEEMNFIEKMLLRGVPNTPQSSEWHSSKVRCENCAKRNNETILSPLKISLMSICISKSNGESMVNQNRVNIGRLVMKDGGLQRTSKDEQNIKMASSG